MAQAIEVLKKCRICGNTELEEVLDLGNQALTGIFPKTRDEKVEEMPLVLVKCVERPSGETCGLLQLKHTGDLSKMYGQNYGYRSGLNQSMVRHLQAKVKKITSFIDLKAGDLVIDIGSNDSTTLQSYSKDLQLVGIDPTGIKFKSYYPDHIELIPDFFSAGVFKKRFGDKKAKVVTSFSMFYDLPEPLQFMKDVSEVLDDDGIWVFEQSYMPTMLEMLSYDTVCHEHLEYYGLKQIQWMMERTDLKILDVEFNDVNGGSFSISAAKKSSTHPVNTVEIQRILDDEERKGLSGLKPFQQFKEKTDQHRKAVRAFFEKAQNEGKRVYGYGASTKGNVLLQWCGVTDKDLQGIAEVNEDKFGSFTPGTRIPIYSEAEVKSRRPDYFFVLPWHFKKNILERESEYLKQGGRLLFPLPSMEVF